MQDDFVNPLLIWYNNSARDLPWRHTRDPYRIWVSEIMLQQTRVEAVKAYYKRFLAALPGIRDLAKVPEEQLLKLWEGLGYYNRVRNMQKAARVIMETHGGVFPEKEAEILALPGIGSYTAGAISSIAFGLPVPAVDGNVLRVVMRLTASREDIAKPSVKKQTEADLRELLETHPDIAPGTFNQAMMELGATVCGPNREPACGNCPVRMYCMAHTDGIETSLPVKSKKKDRRVEEKTILLIMDGEEVAIRKRPRGGLLGGFYEFPGLDGHASEKRALAYVRALGYDAIRIRPLPDAKHIFTHVEWRMTGYQILVGPGEQTAREPETANRTRGLASVRFVNPSELETRYPVPTAFRTYVSCLSVKTGSDRIRSETEDAP